MGRLALDDSPLPSGPSLLLHFGRSHRKGGVPVLCLGCVGGGGQFVQGPYPPQYRLQSSSCLAIDIEVGGLLGGTETGGGVGWGDKPLIFLPFPLLTLFCATL